MSQYRIQRTVTFKISHFSVLSDNYLFLPPLMDILNILPISHTFVLCGLEWLRVDSPHPSSSVCTRTTYPHLPASSNWLRTWITAISRQPTPLVSYLLLFIKTTKHFQKPQPAHLSGEPVQWFDIAGGDPWYTANLMDCHKSGRKEGSL
jgi:hypothetical protein